MADLDITKDDDINQEDLITLDELIRKHGIEKLIKKVTKKVNDQEDISRLLTERELYQLIPPIPKLRRIKSFITTESASRKVPNEPVRLWDDFLSEAFTLSSTLDAKNRIFKRPDFLMLGSFLSVEDSVVDMFLELMKLINNQRLILLPRPERWAKRHLFENVKGQPDAIRCSADNKQLLDEGEASQIQAIVEIKPDQLMKKLLDNKLDLVEAYNRAVNIDDDGTAEFTKHQKIKRIVRQTFGYMVVNDLRYGLLTTYIRTWFFYRDFDDPNILYISPAVAIDQERTSTQISFLECMYYHETISMIDETAHSSPPTDSDKGSDDYDDSSDDDDGDNGGNDEKNDSSYEPRSSSKRKWEDLKVTTRSIAKKKREKRDGNEREKLENMKNYERSQFSFGNMLGNGRFGAVFATKLCGNVGALKMADLYKNEYLLQEILNEIKIYLGPLMDIQCVYIPKLLKFGILHEAFCFILTSLSGKSFAELDDVTEREKQLAIDGLQAIHKRGVIHGDVRLENIVVERSESMSKSRVRWIDFGWSEMGRNSGFDRELFELKSLLV